jgi:RNA polymerase sigma factor (sigma-70 family)
MNKQEQLNIFNDIIEQHSDVFNKVARAYCSDDEDKQDLIQEIMLQIWLSLFKFNYQCKITTWVYRISLNVAISYYRKNTKNTHNHIELNDQIVENATDDKNETEIQLNLLNQFISELKDIDKAIMVLYLDDKSHNEIASILGINVSNVGIKIGRIKEKLKSRFLNLN